MAREETTRFVVGIDLSGPAGFSRTALTTFILQGEALEHHESHEGVDDRKIHDIASDLARRGGLAVGLDAPLSYNIGGGDRPGDKALRKRIVARGMRSGSIMPSTMNKMVYLTLRGFAISRMLSGMGPNRIRVAEVHPGAAMAPRGAPVEDDYTRMAEEALFLSLKWTDGEPGFSPSGRWATTPGNPADLSGGPLPR